jgi:hypothetical protein
MAITDNYKINTSINANSFLTVSINDIDGNDLTPGNYNDFLVKETWVRAEENKSITLPAVEMMDIDFKKLSGYDINLFLYAINNGGELELGLSRIPAFIEVPDDYADNVSKSYDSANFVMAGKKASGTVNCEVIGRIRAKQNSSYEWQTPGTSEEREGRILETDYLISGCEIIGTGNLDISDFTTDFVRYKIINDRIKIEARWIDIDTIGTGESALELQFEPLAPLNDDAVIGNAAVRVASGFIVEQGFCYGYDSAAVGATNRVRVAMYDNGDFGAGTTGGTLSINCDYEYETRVSLPS